MRMQKQTSLKTFFFKENAPTISIRSGMQHAPWGQMVGCALIDPSPLMLLWLKKHIWQNDPDPMSSDPETVNNKDRKYTSERTMGLGGLI